MKKTKDKKSEPGRWVLYVTALIFFERVRIGIATGTDGNPVYAVTVQYKERRELFYYGSCLPLLLRCCVPCFMYADTDLVPLYRNRAVAGSPDDVDEWIERNGSSLLPAGFCESDLYTVWSSNGSSIVAQTTVAQQMDSRIAFYNTKGYCMWCSAALQGYAALWSKKLYGSYAIWKITTAGSQLGIIEDGVVTANCTLWVTTNDIDADPQTACSAAADLLGSMGEGSNPDKLILLPEALRAQCEGSWHHRSVRITPAPVSVHLPEEVQEAYGNTLEHTGNVSQLLTFEQQRTAVMYRDTIKRVSTALRFLVAVTGIVALLAGGYIGISKFGLRYDRESMATLDREYSTLLASAATIDTLFSQVTKKTRFIPEESIVTRLITDMQTVFPEGAAAEEITVSERDDRTWSLEIRAFLRSSALLQPLVAALEKVPGIQNVRMVYSEQVAEKQKKNGFRCKIEAAWR